MTLTLPSLVTTDFVETTKFGASIWWRHEVETFFALLAFCAGNPPVTGEFPAQRLVTRNFDVFFWFEPEPTVEQTIETPVIRDAIKLIMTSL